MYGSGVLQKSLSPTILEELPSRVLDIPQQKPLTLVASLRVLIQYFVFLFFVLLFEFRFL
jgi:hypothetical protein